MLELARVRDRVRVKSISCFLLGFWLGQGRVRVRVKVRARYG